MNLKGLLCWRSEVRLSEWETDLTRRKAYASRLCIVCPSISFHFATCMCWKRKSSDLQTWSCCYFPRAPRVWCRFNLQLSKKIAMPRGYLSLCLSRVSVVCLHAASVKWIPMLHCWPNCLSSSLSLIDGADGYLSHSCSAVPLFSHCLLFAVKGLIW